MRLSEIKEYAEAMVWCEKNGLHFHHSATGRGYVSRRIECECDPYKGRFGEGIIIKRPRWDTCQFYKVEYWLTDKEDD